MPRIKGGFSSQMHVLRGLYTPETATEFLVEVKVLMLDVAVMHADLFENTQLRGLSAQGVRDAHTRFDVYMNQIRQATPDGGSYANEADIEEPQWQKAFFGDNYERLKEVKTSWDPWSLYYVPVGVGSDDWVVRTVDHGLPTQDGPLCRAS